MSELPIKREDAIAFFRYEVISELLDAEPGKIDSTAKKLAQQQFKDVMNKRFVTFSERTIYKYYSNYKKLGFDGLKPKSRSDKGKHPGIDVSLIKDIIDLKKELPTRSAAKIITMLTLTGRLEKDTISTRTVNRILQQYGYTKKSISADTRLYIKHEKDRVCAMWQSDVMSALFIPDGNNGKKLAYLIGIIDDHSRRIMHSEFYFDSKLTRLEDTLKKAIAKHGAPDCLYIDNGKIFIADQFKLLCARLGIKLKYSTPYHPQGKGKIEKYWDYVQNSFIPEIKNQPVDSLSELNDLYFAWNKVEYDEKYHTAIESTPVDRWNTSLNNGTKLRFFSPVEIEEIFLHAEERCVDKYGVISFNGNTYEGPAELIGKTVVIRYNPFHLDYLHVYYKDKYFGVAKTIDLKEKKHKDVASVSEESGYDSEISRLYLKNIKSRYREYLEKQLTLSIDKNTSGLNENESTSIEDHPIKPPKDPVCSISRDEFINIVKAFLNIEELTFQEKGKLNELWSTFKEFNKEILISILDDLSHKANDFNRNFLFYIAKIRTNYLAQLAKLKEVK